MKMMLSIAALFLATPVLAQDAPTTPDWMAGEWIVTDGEGWTEEYWTDGRGGVMIGASKTGKGDRLGGFEHMRIMQDKAGKLTFYAAPQGGPFYAFPMVEQTVDAVTFANPAHDYPQRIRYWRDGDVLKAEVALADGGKAMNWTMARR